MNVDLTRAWLPNSILVDAILNSARLLGATLSGADLRQANLGFCGLVGASLHDVDARGADLTCADLRGAMLDDTDLSDADLTGVIWERTLRQDLREGNGELILGSRGPSLRNVDLRGAKLSGATISPETDLDGAMFGLSPLAPPDDKEHIADEDTAATALDLRECARVYRQLKLAFQASGEYERAGSFFVRERTCLRSALAREAANHRRGANRRLAAALAADVASPDWRGLCSAAWGALKASMYRAPARAFWLVFERVSAYGEDAWRVAKTAALVVLLFAVILGCCGIGVSPNTNAGTEVSQVPFPREFGSALYFSTVTFTSLGHGDLFPINGWGRFWSGVEVACGAVLMSLFLVCIVRKFSR